MGDDCKSIDIEYMKYDAKLFKHVYEFMEFNYKNKITDDLLKSYFDYPEEIRDFFDETFY